MANASYMNSKRYILLIIAALIGIPVLAFGLWPRGPRLELYTSRALKIGGMPTRLQIKVPVGWRVEVPGRDLRTASSGPLFAVPLSAASPRDVPFLTRLSNWLRGSPPEPNRAERAYIIISCWRSTKLDLVEGGISAHSGDNGAFASRMMRDSGFIYTVHYSRGDRAAFDATYRQVCESFRVVRDAK